MTNYITTTERIYRELSAPEAPRPEKESPAKEPEITHAEIEGILSRKRSATPELLQYIIAKAKKFGLSSYQRDRLGLDLSIAVAAKMREARGIREDPAAQFFSEVLNVEQTPAGLLYEAGWFKEQLRMGSKNISSCRQHRAPRCSCWASSREKLYAVRQAFGDKSPEGWAALRVWNALEEAEKGCQHPASVEPV